MRVTDDEDKRLPGHPKTANTKKISQLPKETKIGQDGLYQMRDYNFNYTCCPSTKGSK